jgi:adenylate kinase
MRLILIGPPGSGKGTQATLLSQRLGLAHISTGDMLRDAIHSDTAAGRKARPFMESGQLVPDDLVNQIIADFFRKDDRLECFVMDGYPRTLPQAMSFEQLLRQQFLGLDAVILLKVDDEMIVRRMSGRWVCSNGTCGTPYHSTFKPPRQPGVCDVCGSKLMQRADDQEQTVRKRLQIFHASYGDLLDYYRRLGLLQKIPGVGDIETIYANVVRALKLRKQ